MTGKFMLKADVKRDELDFARLGWLSNPASTGAKQLTVLEGTFFPGKGDSFHYHADQEELIFVVSGLGPCVGEIGTEQVDMSGEAPWNGLRATTT